MRKFWTFLVGASAAFAVAGSAHALDGTCPAGGDKGKAPNSAAAAPHEATSGEEAKIESSLVLASGVVDRPVLTGEAAKRAEPAGPVQPDVPLRSDVIVEDVVIDVDSGRVTHLVLSKTGEEMLSAVPLSAFRIEAGPTTLVEFDVSLAAMPADCPTFDKARFASEKDTGGFLENETAAADGARYLRFEGISNHKVCGADESEIGDVDDLVFDAKTGEIRALLVTSGGFLGMGEALHLIPWGLAEVEEENTVVVNVSATENRDRVQSFPLDGNEEARREFTGRMLNPEDSTPRRTAVAILLVPDSAHRYSVESAVGTVDVAGWESGLDGKPVKTTVTERFTGTYDVRVVEVRENGDAVIEAKLTEKDGESEATYRAVVTKEGRVTDVRREDAAAKAASAGIGEERVQSHLVMIFGGGLPGNELTGEGIDAPDALKPYCGREETESTKIRYSFDRKETADRNVRVLILADEDELGAATYGDRGLLNVLEIRPRGGDECSLRIRALPPETDRRSMEEIDRPDDDR